MPKLRRFAGKAALICQRVEDNAFHLPRVAQRSGYSITLPRKISSGDGFPAEDSYAPDNSARFARALRDVANRAGAGYEPLMEARRSGPAGLSTFPFALIRSFHAGRHRVPVL